MTQSLTAFPIGSRVSFLAGPTRIQVTDAEVTGHEGQFIVTRDAAGKVRKARPGQVQ